jgi:hypothetical protein
MGSVITTFQCCKVSSILPELQSVTVSFEDNRMSQVTNYNFDLIINETIGLGTKYIDFIFPSSYGLTIGNTYNCLIQGYTDPSKTICVVISSTQISLSLTSNFSLILSTLKSVSASTSV